MSASKRKKLKAKRERWRSERKERRRINGGRFQTTYQRDHGTPELVARRMRLATELGFADHPEATCHPGDALWRSGQIDIGMWDAGIRYGALFAQCNMGPGLAKGLCLGSAPPDSDVPLLRLRDMQRRLTPAELAQINRVFGLVEWPGWIIERQMDGAQAQALISALRLLATGQREPPRERERMSV